MFKRITKDKQEGKPLEPYILGIKYSSTGPIEGQAGEAGENMAVGETNDGKQPSFDMPPYANGQDLRPGH